MSPQGDAHRVELASGPVHYRDLGSGEPIVFVHGYLVNGLLWRDVASRLDGFRRIVPDLPLGAHPEAMAPDADLSPPGLARLLAELLDRLELRGVTLVGNDTGGAICQLVVTRHPDRIARLVLTNCDAFENFPPRGFRLLPRLARVPGALTALMQPARLGVVRKMSFRPFARRPFDEEVLEAFLHPFLSDRRIREDTLKVTRGISNAHTLEAAARFGEFDGPVLLAWAARDRFFPIRYAERLASAFADARLETVEGSRTFVPQDAPERLAGLISEFARGGLG